VSYLNMARCYEKLGQYCDAMIPVQTWVALDPARNDTSQTRAILDDYSRKGQCAAGEAGRDEKVSIARVGQTIKVRAVVNGVPGTFIVDTGATFMSLKHSFAEKAGVAPDSDTLVKLNTANGITSARRGRAKAVALGKLVAKDVPVVIQTDERATYGAGIDGLLGMSFLSRFDMTLGAKTLELKSRRT
jgi:clan AA aspartic protease (TIGR02281 family)